MPDKTLNWRLGLDEQQKWLRTDRLGFEAGLRLSEEAGRGRIDSVQAERGGVCVFRLFPASGLTIPSCVVTLDTNRGGKVRVELDSATPSALAAFVKELGV